MDGRTVRGVSVCGEGKEAVTEKTRQAILADIHARHSNTRGMFIVHEIESIAANWHVRIEEAREIVLQYIREASDPPAQGRLELGG